MLKESVHALKEELHSEVVKPFVEKALESGVLGIRTRRLEFAATPHTVGLGITAKNKSEDGFQLAVRVQHPGLRRSPLITHIKERARGEVDVRYIGHVRPFYPPWYQDTSRPMLIGSSIAHFRLTAGTLGAFVRDRVSGEICVLSNNHVLADENNGSVGDIILQPGTSDGGQIPGGMVAALPDLFLFGFRGLMLSTRPSPLSTRTQPRTLPLLILLGRFKASALHRLRSVSGCGSWEEVAG